MKYTEEKLNIAIHKWSLQVVEEIYILENRAVYSVESEQYGASILKINQDAACMFREYEMLRALAGKHCCRIYEFDRGHGILLEEKLKPGIVLRNETDVDIRIKRFAEVFQEIHYAPPVEAQFDTYSDWLYRACAKMQRIKKPEDLSGFLTIARNICRKMFEKYPERVLLHGDLHHDNILLTVSGSYSMIDPKGVIGPRIFDISRFIMNEFDPAINQSGKEHIYHVIKELYKLLNYPLEDMKQLLFMEVVLGNSWLVEDGKKPDMESVAIAAAIYEDCAL